MDEKKQSYSLTLNYLLEQLKKTDDQILFGQQLLRHFFNSESDSYNGIIELLVDILWLNYSVLKIITPVVEDAEPQYNEETGENEYMIDHTSMVALQTLAMARYQTTKELNQRSYSIREH